jgi:hypothetical protein
MMSAKVINLIDILYVFTKKCIDFFIYAKDVGFFLSILFVC